MLYWVTAIFPTGDTVELGAWDDLVLLSDLLSSTAFAGFWFEIRTERAIKWN